MGTLEHPRRFEAGTRIALVEKNATSFRTDSLALVGHDRALVWHAPHPEETAAKVPTRTGSLDGRGALDPVRERAKRVLRYPDSVQICCSSH